MMIPGIPKFLTQEEFNYYFEEWQKIFPCELPYKFVEWDLLGINLLKNYQALLIAAMEKNKCTSES